MRTAAHLLSDRYIHHQIELLCQPRTWLTNQFGVLPGAGDTQRISRPGSRFVPPSPADATGAAALDLRFTGSQGQAFTFESRSACLLGSDLPDDLVQAVDQPTERLRRQSLDDIADSIDGQCPDLGATGTPYESLLPDYAVYAWRRIESTPSRSIATANAPRTAISNVISPSPYPVSITLRRALFAYVSGLR